MKYMKLRYVTALLIITLVILGGMTYSYQQSLSRYVDRVHTSLSTMSKSVAFHYDAIFNDICTSVENTIDSTNASLSSEDIQGILQEEITRSNYIVDLAVIPQLEAPITTGQPLPFQSDMYDDFFDAGTSQVCMGLIKDTTRENVFYAVNLEVSEDFGKYLLLVAIDYNAINTMAQPEIFTDNGGYVYMLSTDGYFLFHPDERLMGLNVNIDKKYIQDITGLNDSDYKILVSLLTQNPRADKNNIIQYHAIGIEKIGYYRPLEKFEGTVVLSMNYTALMNSQHKAIYRSFIPLVSLMLLALIILIRYIYTIKYTNYFTEIKNDLAFKRYIEKLKKTNTQAHFALIKIENVIENNKPTFQFDDNTANAITTFLLSAKDLYQDIYRLSRVHYIFVLHDNSVSKKNSALLDALRKNYETDKGRCYQIRGKSLFVTLDNADTLEYLDLDNVLIRYMEQHFKQLTDTDPIHFEKYSEILNDTSSHEDNKLILETALSEGTIKPFYQPIVELKSGVIVKNEALMRITHNGEILSPAPFIRIAEEEGLMEKIDRVMITKVFQCYHQFHANFKLKLDLSLNISAKSINKGFIDYIIYYAQKSKIQFDHITFELTETAAIQDMNSTIAHLERLKSEGFKLALDDFGTGYSHIELISLIKVDYIKINRAFIQDAFKSEKTLKTLNALVYLAKNYNSKIVAEYVEDAKILAVLKKLEIDYGQGYYLGEPGPNPVLDNFIDSKRIH